MTISNDRVTISSSVISDSFTGEAQRLISATQSLHAVFSDSMTTVFTISGGATEPSNQPTGLQFANVTSTSFDVSFTASVGGADGYVAFRRSGASPTFVPVDTTTYTVGNSYGDSTCAHFGSGTSFSESGLSASTVYCFDVFSFNGTTGTYNYLTTSPLEGSQTTYAAQPSAQPTSLVFSDVKSTSMTLSWTGSGADGYLALRRSGASPTGTPADGTAYSVNDVLGDGTVEFVGSGTTFTDSGLTSGVTYYYDIFAYNGTTGTYNYLVTTPLEGSQDTFAFGNAIHLDGSNDYGTISATSFFGGKTQFKLSFWVYFDVGAANQAIIWDGNSGVTNGFAIRTATSNNNLTLWFGNGAAGNTATTPLGGLGTGAWKHVSVEYLGSGATNADKVIVKIDNSPVTLTFASTIPTSIGNSTVTCSIGARGTGANFLNGLLDEMCLWTDTTGSDTYDSGGGAFPTSTNLQNYWKFNESNNATTAVDNQAANNIVFTNLNFDANSGWEAHT